MQKTVSHFSPNSIQWTARQYWQNHTPDGKTLNATWDSEVGSSDEYCRMPTNSNKTAQSQSVCLFWLSGNFCLLANRMVDNDGRHRIYNKIRCKLHNLSKGITPSKEITKMLRVSSHIFQSKRNAPFRWSTVYGCDAWTLWSRVKTFQLPAEFVTW